VHYPRSVGEFGSWFATDADCLDYLEWMRWPAGFCCPSCGHDEGWRLGDRRFECAGCRARTSTTAGTIFDRTRTPLTVWFAACWAFASDKGGVSALGLQRTLEIGSYQTRTPLTVWFAACWARHAAHRCRARHVVPRTARIPDSTGCGVVVAHRLWEALRPSDVTSRGARSATSPAVRNREHRPAGRCRHALPQPLPDPRASRPGRAASRYSRVAPRAPRTRPD
jgi:hypothetical protein